MQPVAEPRTATVGKRLITRCLPGRRMLLRRPLSGPCRLRNARAYVKVCCLSSRDRVNGRQKRRLGERRTRIAGRRLRWPIAS